MENSAVRSPSGNLLAIDNYFDRPDRPLSLRERQERIRARVEQAREAAAEATAAGNGQGHDGSEKRKWARFCGCW